MVGEWTYVEGLSGTWKCEWLGEYFVVCDEEGEINGVAFKDMEVYGYDVRQGVYTLQRFQAGGGY